MPIDNFDQGRDATGPAERTIGTDERTTTGGKTGDLPGMFAPTDDDQPGSPGLMPDLHETNARIHAGRMYLMGVAYCLPGRLVKRIDVFALRVLRSPVGRYCV